MDRPQPAMREATLHISISDLADLGLREIIEHPSSAGIERLTQLMTHGSGGIHYVVVDEPLPPAALDATTALVWWERLVTEGEVAEYLWKLQAQESEDSGALPADVADFGTPDGTQADLTVSVIGPPACLPLPTQRRTETERTVSGTYLDRVTSSPHNRPPWSRLTDRQQQVLRLAYDMGYYEVPRMASSADIATRLALDPSTVAEHLQRAERNLIEALLE